MAEVCFENCGVSSILGEELGIGGSSIIHVVIVNASGRRGEAHARTGRARQEGEAGNIARNEGKSDDTS